MNDKLLEHQRALLLLHLLGAPDRTLTKGDANKKLTTVTKKSLDLTTSAANQLREALVNDGYIAHQKEKRSIKYQLTEKGLALLAAQEQYPPLDIRLKGRELNALLGAVRDLAADWHPPIQPPGHQAMPEDLASRILAIFQELERERSGFSQLVPIHEIRRRVAERWGAAAADHDHFDEQVKKLWREGKLRMVPISDMRDCTPEQLMDSIPGINETHFYVEAIHEPAALR